MGTLELSACPLSVVGVFEGFYVVSVGLCVCVCVWVQLSCGCSTGGALFTLLVLVWRVNEGL